LRDRNGAWTYGELEARSNRLAHQLVAAGLRPEDSVAIYARTPRYRQHPENGRPCR
jgi:non-ribosomal peptide synthetase component F